MLWDLLHVRRPAAAAPRMRVVVVIQVHVEQIEDDAEHSRPQAIAQAPHACDHALDSAWNGDIWFSKDLFRNRPKSWKNTLNNL